MTYVMEKALVDHVNAQRKEAEEFSKQPGCWMGKFPCPTDIEYWSDRVPSGTLREFNRIQLVEDAYYITADHTSKSYARSLNFSNWSNEKLQRHIDRICAQAERERKIDYLEKVAEEARLDDLAKNIGTDRETLNRWMEAA